MSSTASGANISSVDEEIVAVMVTPSGNLSLFFILNFAYALLRYFGSLKALSRASFKELRHFLPKHKVEPVMEALSMSNVAEAEHAAPGARAGMSKSCQMHSAGGTTTDEGWIPSKGNEVGDA